MTEKLISIFLYIIIITSFVIFLTTPQRHLANRTEEIQSIYIKENVLNDISKIALNDDKEILVCLKGKKIDDYYNITSYSIPKDIERNEEEVNVTGLTCLFDIGNLHSHPDTPMGWCELSDTDLVSFGASHNKINGLICIYRDDYRFMFISKDNPSEEMEIFEYE